MKFGGLSEKEMKAIEVILQDAGVKYDIQIDEHITAHNEKSMSNILRHYNGPDISTDMLAVEIDQSDFENLKQGQIVSVRVDEASEYDLWGKVIK